MQIWPEWNAHTLPIAVTAVVEVGVVEHERGALAAELEQQALHRAAADLAMRWPDAGRAGERHHVDVAGLDERRRRRRASSR